MLIYNQLRLNFDFWRSSFARMRRVRSFLYYAVAGLYPVSIRHYRFIGFLL